MSDKNKPQIDPKGKKKTRGILIGILLASIVGISFVFIIPAIMQPSNQADSTMQASFILNKYPAGFQPQPPSITDVEIIGSQVKLTFDYKGPQPASDQILTFYLYKDMNLFSTPNEATIVKILEESSAEFNSKQITDTITIGTTYYAMLTSIDGYKSVLSNVITATLTGQGGAPPPTTTTPPDITTMFPPAAPVILSVSDMGATDMGFTITFATVQDVLHYKLYISTTTQVFPNGFVSLVDFISTTAPPTTLTHNIDLAYQVVIAPNYYIVITAFSQSGKESEGSNLMTITRAIEPPAVTITIPDAPTGLTVTKQLQNIYDYVWNPNTGKDEKVLVGTQTRITLTWIAPANNGGSPITSYEIYENGNLKTSVGVVTYQFIRSSTATSASYYIKARNAAGVSMASSNVVTA